MNLQKSPGLPRGFSVDTDDVAPVALRPLGLLAGLLSFVPNFGPIASALPFSGADRIILCRCGSADAVRWGQELGIRLFQGRYVDSRLRAQRSPSIAAARQAIRSAAG